MTALRTIIVPSCAAERFARLAPALLEQEVGAPTLLVAELAGDTLFLGRHQRTASALVASAGPALRRAGGGKALRAAPATVGVLLAVPHGGWAERLDPDKVLNRCVRGLLRALPKVGASGGAYYFGRDFVVSQQHQIAVISQDGAPGGTLLFEALIAAAEPLALPAGVSAYPEHPDARAQGPPHGSLRGPRFEDVVRAIVDGYTSLLGATLMPEAEAPDPGPPLGPDVVEEEEGFHWSFLAAVPIGFLQAGVRADGKRIAEVRLRGDFMAPAFAVAALEQALRGKRFEIGDVGPAVDAAFGRGGAPIIGVRDLRVVADCILDAGRVCFAT